MVAQVKDKKKSILINFDKENEEKHTKLKIIAAEQNTSMTAIIIKLIDEFLKKHQ